MVLLQVQIELLSEVQPRMVSLIRPSCALPLLLVAIFVAQLPCDLSRFPPLAPPD